jgi:hypothetical protein
MQLITNLSYRRSMVSPFSIPCLHYKPLYSCNNLDCLTLLFTSTPVFYCKEKNINDRIQYLETLFLVTYGGKT